MKTKLIYLALALLPVLGTAQETLRGMIMVQNDGDVQGLPGANVYWSGTDLGVSTDLDGWFTIVYKPEYKDLVVSYVGYTTDTLTVTSNKELHHLLEPKSSLDEVRIETKRRTSFVSYVSTANVQKISSEELLKAACCNLSESFTTNPSIDVNFSDAITGTKQINMLGLNSPYILIAQENIPMVRGASQAYGLTFTPGTWIESIQVTKGAGSVVNGYESIAGQINAELVKPLTDKKFFVNVYRALYGRTELNTHFNEQLSDKWSTGVYVHGNIRSRKVDENNDNFLDTPLAKQINIMNRWQYQDAEKGWVSFVNFRYLKDEKQAGELDYDPDSDRLTTNVPVLSGDEVWGSEIFTDRFDVSAKLGYVFPEASFNSLGFQIAYSNHKQDSYYGLRTYEIQHNSVYSSLLFNSIIGDTRHKIKTGLSFTYDGYEEMVSDLDYSRNDNALGGFFEYAYDNLENFSLTVGIRADAHNNLGFFVTPRLHVRYVPWEKGVLRASIGRGKRSANIFAENQQLFASNRAIVINDSGGTIYGLDPEIAWNFGFSFLQGFNLFDRKASAVVDFYRTDFVNQVVVDWENPQEIGFYNLDGNSVANSFQVELDYNVAKYMDVKFSYKYYDVTTDYATGANEKPLVPKHRFFANLSGELFHNLDRLWRYNITYNWVGEQRFPFTQSNPQEYQKPVFSGIQNLLNLQVTKVFSRKFELYLGVENVTNTVQDDPILAADDPFGMYFDSTMIYAPIHGANYYTGLRYSL